MKSVYTTGQVGKICHVGARTVANWFDSGRLKGYRVPGSNDRRVPRHQLIKFMKEYGIPLGVLEGCEYHKILAIGMDGVMPFQLQKALDFREYQFKFTNCTFQAGGLSESFRPDTVIVDFSVGRLQAINIATTLRKNPLYQPWLILGLANEDEQDMKELFEKDFSEVFQKPFDPDVVAQRIRIVADQQREKDR